MKVFWRHGYPGTSIAALTDAMGIAAPSLYAAFGDKASLYREALQHYEKTIAPGTWSVLWEAPTARLGVEGVLTRSATLQTRDDVPRGCMAVLADGDGADLTKEICLARAGAVTMLARRIQQGIDAGELAASTDAARLARFYATVQQGMAIQARDGASTEELLEVARTAMAVWPEGPLEPRAERASRERSKKR